MLTKDLVKARTRGQRLYPSQIEPDNSECLTTATILLEIFTSAVGQSVHDLNEQVEFTAVPREELKAPLVKLLFDQAELDEDDGQTEIQRWEILRRAESLRSQPFATQTDLVEELARERSLSATALKEGLYGDLPDCRRVGEIKLSQPEALLHRYNCAQVQAQLLRSTSVTLVLKGKDLKERRLLFRAMKFHRLLGEITLGDKELTLNLSGPMSLFSEAKSYGLKIAQFFPHILHLKDWELRAEVRDRERRLDLVVDPSMGLKSHYAERSLYIPPEFQACVDEFNQRYAPHVRAEPAAEFIHLGRESYCFPDLSFSVLGATPIHLEIFHKWHAGQLPARLAALALAAPENLRLAVDNSILKKSEHQALIASSPWFERFGFGFTQFPTPKKIWGSLGLGDA